MVKINEFYDMEIDKNKPLFAPLPFNVAEDLMIYMRNDPMFYRKKYWPVIDHIHANKKSRDAIDTKRIDRLINDGIVSYCNEYKIPHDPMKLLDSNDRHEIISKIIEDELA
jgi:hypothetical protein